MFVDIVAYIAGTLVISSLLPQIIKSWKTKSTRDLSLWRAIIYVVGVSLWLVYGILILNAPLIVINIISLVFAGFVLYLKVKYG